jgi:hypothetical protein
MGLLLCWRELLGLWSSKSSCDRGSVSGFLHCWKSVDRTFKEVGLTKRELSVPLKGIWEPRPLSLLLLPGHHEVALHHQTLLNLQFCLPVGPKTTEPTHCGQKPFQEWVKISLFFLVSCLSQEFVTVMESWLPHRLRQFVKRKTF